LNAVENITLPMDIAGQKPDQKWLDQVIDTLGLRDRLKHRPSQLSGGQQQRVACARALASRPELIFADEPTGNLDSRAGLEVLGFLREAVDELGQTVVMVTHDPSAAAHSDLVLFLGDGRIVDEIERPTADAVLERLRRSTGRPGHQQNPESGPIPAARDAEGVTGAATPDGSVYGTGTGTSTDAGAGTAASREPGTGAGPATGPGSTSTSTSTGHGSTEGDSRDVTPDKD
ncbi:ABC transporter ATP-binding protein, partial [Streptomyces sp. NPDC057757]|uniref:ABC transporter ATP-binding protein n=1 Tax=Streptomyces sp. NPDC057757 TaxID=3346241 RepID=UPI0036904AFB